MKTDILGLISLHRFKNGRVKISHDTSNEANIYRLLYAMGFRQGTLDGKRVHFHKEGRNIKICYMRDLKDAFYHFLEAEQYSNCPDDLTREMILDWFLEKNPIRQNGLFEYYLKEDIKEYEAEQLRR